jgi:hypothetical protein
LVIGRLDSIGFRELKSDPFIPLEMLESTDVVDFIGSPTLISRRVIFA